MKRILTLLMAVSLLLCLAACGQPADHAPEQPPQQAEPSEPPAQTEPPALEGEALSVLPAEDAGLAEPAQEHRACRQSADGFLR